MATKQTDRANRAKLLAALEGAARPLSRTEISGVFGRNLSKAEIDRVIADLQTEGLVTVAFEPAQRPAKTPSEILILNSYVAHNGHEPSAESAPPTGEGWLPKQATIRKAQHGVMPASAERVGKRLRSADAKTAREAGTATGRPRISAEALGAAHLIRLVLINYVRQGVIEVQGDWIRLVRNPSRRPPRHWHEALLQFLAEGHPTLDGKWHRKPKKTLVGVTEAALGRPLEPHERVRRFPGFAGSWDPRHILLFDSEQETVTTLAEIQSRTS